MKVTNTFKFSRFITIISMIAIWVYILTDIITAKKFFILKWLEALYSFCGMICIVYVYSYISDNNSKKEK